MDLGRICDVVDVTVVEVGECNLVDQFATKEKFDGVSFLNVAELGNKRKRAA